MNSFTANLPWTTPAPLGLILGTNFQVLAFILAALLIVVDVIIYYPFLKVYDEQILTEEAAGTNSSDALKEKVAANFDTKKLMLFLKNQQLKKPKKSLIKLMFSFFVPVVVQVDY